MHGRDRTPCVLRALPFAHSLKGVEDQSEVISVILEWLGQDSAPEQRPRGIMVVLGTPVDQDPARTGEVSTRSAPHGDSAPQANSVGLHPWCRLPVRLP